jgi:hypothetical protein
MDQKDIFLIDFLFILLNSVGERPLFVPPKAKEVFIVLFDQDAVDLAILKLLQRLE